MGKKKPAFLRKKNLLALAKESVGSRIFRRLYYRIGPKDIDILENGNLSCAFFVSGLLKLLGLIPELHTTVQETVKDLKRAGWRKIGKPRAGSVVVYAPKTFGSGNTHGHVGIYIGSGLVASNRDIRRSPKIDQWNYRPVEYILWHKKLEE